MKRVSCVILFLLVLVALFSQEYIVYPNPIRSDGILHIQSIDSLLPPIIKVYNMSGRLVLIEDIGYGNREATISFLGLSRGMYIIWLEDYNNKKKQR
jgi:hypothetical protein